MGMQTIKTPSFRDHPAPAAFSIRRWTSFLCASANYSHIDRTTAQLRLRTPDLIFRSSSKATGIDSAASPGVEDLAFTSSRAVNQHLPTKPRCAISSTMFRALASELTIFLEPPVS